MFAIVLHFSFSLKGRSIIVCGGRQRQVTFLLVSALLMDVTQSLVLREAMINTGNVNGL